MNYNNFCVDNIDILSQVNNSGLSVDPNKTGLGYIIKEIRDIANLVFEQTENTNENVGSIKNIFIEYSSVAVMLSDSKMIGFAALDKENDSLFNELVKKHAFDIIGTLGSYGLSIYIHPDFVSSAAIHKYDVGVSHQSSLYNNLDIEKITKSLGISRDELDKKIKCAKEKGSNTDSIIESNLYWSGTYDWTYDKLIKSIDVFRKTHNPLPPLEDLFTLYKYCYDQAFVQDDKKNSEQSCFFGVPLLGAQSGEMPISGQGAAFIYFTYDNNIPCHKVNEFIKILGSRIDYILKGYLFNLLAFSALYLKEQAKQEAEKAAKAAIMSRNMSHNIGSHVMSYLKQHLSSVTSIINDNVLAEMITSASDTTAIPSDKPLPFLVGMGHFLSYIQERQDFIATIATDYIPYFSTVNFKDFIYDELNLDKRFERHKDRKNLQPDNIMLGNIARSEGLGRKIQTTSKCSGQLSDIVLNFRDSKGHIFDGEPVVNSSNVIITGRIEASLALEAMRKLEVSLPGGVIGRQAIFSIVENIIRNAAKHGNWRDKGKLELTFEFYDKESIDDEFKSLKHREASLLGKKDKDGNLKLSKEEIDDLGKIRKELEKWTEDAAPAESSYVWREKGREKHLSLMEVFWLFYSQSIDVDDLFFVTITDNINVSEESVKKLRDALTEDYIDIKSQKMNEGNKGIKEIRISAAWLRGAKNEDEYFMHPTDDKKPQTGEKAPLVYIRQHNGCLQYIICLQKPRNVAVVTQYPLSTTAIKALMGVNWKYYSPEDYIKERNKSYQFTICENRDIFNTIRPFSSSRVYVPGSDSLWSSIKNGISESDGEKYEKELYQSLVKEKSTIWIDDDKAKGGMVSRIRDEEGYAIQEDEGYYKVNDVDVCVIDGCHSHVDYIYRKHHDTLDQFKTFMGVNPNGCLFVESITGDTSTDRLVRNEKYDFRWYYSHLHAMQKKVAIFDERLFSRVYGLEEADFTKGSVADLDELKKKYCEIKPLSRRRINDCKTFDDLKKIVNDMNLPPIEESRSDVYTKDYIALTYFQKGVCFYTLIRDSVEDSSTISFGVYGLYYEGENCLMPQCDDKYSCRCERIATISWQNQALKVAFEESSKKQIENQFDFISIHQGLLDKLYEAFDIKSSQEEKIQLTTTLCRRFAKISSDNSHDWKDGFIPGMIIHSGRSKPAENDMPQMLPFIQYASIEHAVLDCKYSLIDLLENARYEQ